ncbi:MAG TPA: hypothetical protein VH280_12035 [Verrucomicrobiae bacterium]|nr:hypothetical protein [Verrucomicrobiae bacterium]
MQIENSSYNGKDGLHKRGLYTRLLRLFFLSVSVLSFLSFMVMPYCEGRANATWIVPPLFPAAVVPIFVLFLSTAVLFFCMVGSIRARGNFSAASTTFLVSFMLFAVSFAINYPRLYLHGFKNYAKTILTTDEWRTISRVAHAHITPGDSLREPDDMDQDKNQQARWAQFRNDTKIQKLGPYVTIYVPNPQTTEIESGSSFFGCRGVVIYSNTNKMSPPEDSVDGPPLFFAPDIATFTVAP